MLLKWFSDDLLSSVFTPPSLCFAEGDEDIGGGTTENASDDLRAALAESMTGEAAAPVTEKPATVAAETKEETPATEAKPGERQRGPDGKFLPKAPGGEDAPAATATPETAAPAASTDEAKPAAQPDTPAVEPPQHWDNETKAKFSALPAEAKAFVSEQARRMEAAYTPKLQRLGALERDYGPVTDIFAPYAEEMKGRNITPANLIQQWAGVEQGLLRHKGSVEQGVAPDDNGPAIIARMISAYKVDPAAVARLLTNGIPAQPVAQLPPQVINTLNELKERQAAIESRDAQAREGAAAQQIETFANEKDADGNLSHPFFAEVEKDMGALVPLLRAQGQTVSLPDLYDRAIHANPTTRAKLANFQKEIADKRASAAAKAKTEAARRAGASVTGSPSGASPTPRSNGNSSVSDDLRASIEEARA